MLTAAYEYFYPEKLLKDEANEASVEFGESTEILIMKPKQAPSPLPFEHRLLSGLGTRNTFLAYPDMT